MGAQKLLRAMTQARHCVTLRWPLSMSYSLGRSVVCRSGTRRAVQNRLDRSRVGSAVASELDHPSLCLLVTTVGPAKTGERIEMPFGFQTRGGTRNLILYCNRGGPDTTRRGYF